MMYVVTQSRGRYPMIPKFLIVVAKTTNNFQVTNRSRKVVLPFRMWNKMMGWLQETIDTSRKDQWFPKSPNVVPERRAPTIRYNHVRKKWHKALQHFKSTVSSRWFRRPFVRCPQFIREVSMDGSRMTALCHAWIRRLPKRQFCKKVP